MVREQSGRATMSYIIGEEYWHLEHETHTFTASDWHGKYKMECFRIFGFMCSSCGSKIKLSEGVVHHKTYKHKGGIYQVPPHEIKDKICLMCHNCHKHEHESYSIDNMTKILPHEKELYSCIDCGESYEDSCNILHNGKCELCNNLHQKTMSEYVW